MDEVDEMEDDLTEKDWKKKNKTIQNCGTNATVEPR